MESTKKQRQIIKIAQRQLDIDDHTYRTMLMNEYQVDSCTKLTSSQAEHLIRQFETDGFVLTYKKAVPRQRIKRGKSVVRLVSKRELAKIRAVGCLIEWKYDDGYERWLKKRFGIEKVITSEQAFRVIEGLKGLLNSQMTRECGSDWMNQFHNDPGLMLYIKYHKGDERRKR